MTTDCPWPLPEGLVDEVTVWGAIGWAWIPAHPDAIVTVQARVHERVLGWAVANHMRHDVGRSGRGTGLCGFVLRFQRPVTADEVVTFNAISPDGTTASIPFVPISEVVGFVDVLTRERAVGWTWRPETPDTPLTVEAVLDGVLIAQTIADRHVEHLQSSGRGTGRYGFELNFDPWMAGDSAPKIQARFENRIFALPGTAALRPAEPAASLRSSAPADVESTRLVEGHVDRLTRWEASGWAWIPSNPHISVEIRAILDGKIIGRAVADELRQDLADLGKGTGRYGYRLIFDTPVVGETAPLLLPYVPAAQALDCKLTLPVASQSDMAERPRGTIEMLLAGHSKFTGAGLQFEEFDDTILAGVMSAGTTLVPWLIAFYLPQFHAIEANDKFWGTGFTEWRQLSRGISRYPRHYQPRTPRDLGFYNLLDIQALKQQFAMAKAAGVTAFAYYYYWFNGTRVLEKPLDNLLASDVDVPFMIIWANENWTRTWDGSESSILLRQDYRKADDKALVADLARHFADPRYLRVAGRPLFVIYNPGNIPDTAKAIARWRKLLRAQHKSDPLIFMAQTFGVRDPAPSGFDGALEFPPHKLADELPGRHVPDAYSPTFTGRVIDYEDFVITSLGEATQAFPLIKTAVPSWDNESRRPNRGLSLEGASPLRYEAWLRGLYVKAMRHPILGQPIVAVNAWNEWAEGAYLEPDVHFGAAYLNATARARRSAMTLVSADTATRPRISVIFPNYNHEAFIVERITSVLNQTILPDEIIFLDDCSSDGSVALARETLEKSDIPFQLVLNTQKSGGVFHQWIKGLTLAQHELIWIAETDDSAHPDFLLHVLPQFEREDVAGAFGHIRDIDVQGKKLDTLEEYLDDLQNFSWNRSTVVPAYRAFARDFTVKNIVPNVSGMVFRKPKLTEAEVARLVQYQFAGDWYLYALVLRGGSIAYCRAAVSYFRLNPSSASRSAFFTDNHLAEHAMIISDLRHLYDVSQQAIDAHVASLARYLKDRSTTELRTLLTSSSSHREPPHPLRICIAVHSFDIGGGELMPLELANNLRSEGHHITYLVIEKQRSGNSNLRNRLRSDVPVVYWDEIKEDFSTFLIDHGIEVLNSHNVSVDYRLAQTNQTIGIPYVVSMHGGYETVPDLLTREFCTYMASIVTTWFFLSQKNLTALRKNGMSEQTFKHSFNAVTAFDGEWIDRNAFRAEHGISKNAFVLVQCSRAIEEKGWSVAIDVIAAVAKQTKRDVHLVLIGEGPAADRLRTAPTEDMRHVTLLGSIETPVRYFRCFDAAIFASTFIGESFPLFLLEAFMAGLPVISTDIGEISQIMGADKTRRPGATVAHDQDRQGIVAAMTKELVRVLKNRSLLKDMSNNASDTFRRFDMSELTRFYVEEFRRICKLDRYNTKGG